MTKDTEIISSKGKISKKKLEALEKEDEVDSKISMLLSKEKKPYQSLGIGIHDGHYYIGTVLEDDKKKYNAVVVDNGAIYVCWHPDHNDEIKSRFGLNYRFDLFDDVMDYVWSNKSIESFRKDKQEPGQELNNNFSFVFEVIKKINKDLIYHPDERVHDYVACDIISNYFYPIFNSKGRTYFQAEFSSGKSRQCAIYQLLSFNPLFASNITPASFERVIESTGGTIIVDNFDNMNDDLKKAILQIIEVYYKKGGKNVKADGLGKQKNRPIAFNGYSPLVINNIIGLPEVTESRCNKIQMLRSDNSKVVDKKISLSDPRWKAIRDDLHIMALKRWKDVSECYKNLNVPELNARDLERAEAVLTIAKMVSKDVYSRVLNWILENNEQQSIKDISDSWDFIIFEYLNELVKEGEVKVKVADICDKLISKIASEDDRDFRKKKYQFSHYIGKILSGVPVFKKKLIGNYPHYCIGREELSKFLKIKKFDRYLTIPNPTYLNIPIIPIHTSNTNKDDNK